MRGLQSHGGAGAASAYAGNGRGHAGGAVFFGDEIRGGGGVPGGGGIFGRAAGVPDGAAGVPDGAADRSAANTASNGVMGDLTDEAPPPMLPAALVAADLTPARRVRLMYELGLQAAVIGTPAHLSTAERYLTEAASQAQVAGLRRWRAQALGSLVFNVHYLRGELDRAAASITSVLALCDPDSQQAAYSRILAAQIDIDYGHHASAVQSLSAARAAAIRLRNDNILAFVAWVQARFAASREDQASALLWLEEAERRAGTWFSSVYGHVFLLDAAVTCGQVGAEEQAARFLQRAAQRPSDVPQAMVHLATALHAGRFGEPAAASAALAELVTGGQIPQRFLWQVQLLRALAEHRGGDSDAARTLLADAIGRAEAITDRSLPERLDPAAMRELAAVAPAPGSPDDYRIRLLGAFEIVRGGVLLASPSGRAGELVAMLALRRDRRMSVDDAVERLWPGSAPGVGRQRLRNVLLRVRSAVGDLVGRSGNDVVLAAGAVIDVEQFLRAAAVARAAKGDARAAHARAALDFYIGDLLPPFAYADWAQAPRERLRERALALHTIVAADAERRCDIDAAIGALTHMHDLDPLSEAHPLRAARLLTAAGQPGRARAWWARADQICAELGLPLPERATAAVLG